MNWIFVKKNANNSTKYPDLINSYKPLKPTYKLFFPNSPIYQPFTQGKYKSQNLDINGFLS